jgi:hypothetical protein
MVECVTKRGGLAVFLGAGFSKWAAGLPVAAQLFDFQVEAFGVTEETKLRVVTQLKAAWDGEHVDGTAEQFIAYALSLSPRSKAAILWYLVRRLSEPYIWNEWHAGRWRRHVLMIDENRKLERPGVTRARHFLVGLGNDITGILTTNYDLIVEYALGTELFNYGERGEVLFGRGAYPLSQWRNPVALTGPIPVAKMHGSISWDSRGRYTDGRRGLTGNALIVAPIPEKLAPAALAAVWDLAGRILQQSSRLLVFGFAFNPYDEALLNHIAEHGRNVQAVVLIDINPNLGRAKQLWPQANLTAFPPPPEGSAGLAEWLAGRSRIDHLTAGWIGPADAGRSA